MIHLKGNIPSSKNSQVMTKRGIFKSKTVSQYLQKIGVQSYSSSKKTYENYKTRINQIEKIRPEFLEMVKDKKVPLKVGFYFIRDSKRKADFHNLVQILADLFTAHNLIVDDSMDYFIPVFLGYHVDKENAGVNISIL
jgi:Holliday junction resolvase RusA-like endonuclease